MLAAVGLQPMAGVAAAATAVAPQSAAIGGLLGSAAGVQALAPQGFNPYSAIYADQQLSPQAFAGAQFQQFGQQFGGIDPGYAACIASVYGQGRFPFMGFGRQWQTFMQ